MTFQTPIQAWDITIIKCVVAICDATKWIQSMTVPVVAFKHQKKSLEWYNRELLWKKLLPRIGIQNSMQRQFMDSQGYLKYPAACWEHYMNPKIFSITQ